MTTQPNTPPGIPGVGGMPATVARLRGQIRALGDILLAARSATELMDTIAELETLKSSIDALELAVVGELDATAAVKTTGWASTADFLTHISGGHKSTGPATLRLAHAIDTPQLAPVGVAISDGWLSTAKAHVIDRAIEALPSNPALRERAVQVLLDEARRLDATDLKKTTRRLLSIVDPDGQDRRDEAALEREERAAHHHRHLTLTDDGAGGAWIKGHCTSEDAARFKATLMPLARPAPLSDQEPDPRDHGARMLDALTELCRRAQSADLLPECHGATPRVSVAVSLEDLRNHTGYGTTETGETLPVSTVLRLCCDAEIHRILLSPAGEVLDVGRQQRLVTPAIWKALVARDRHCRFPHCTRPPLMTHAHHITHWANGGKTSLQNLILLCGHHHRLVHNGPWTIHATSPTQFTFDPPPGTRGPTSRPPPDG